jgi:hypothetical protein
VPLEGLARHPTPSQSTSPAPWSGRASELSGHPNALQELPAARLDRSRSDPIDTGRACALVAADPRPVDGSPVLLGGSLRAGSGRGAVPALPPVRFPDPPSEPDLPIPEHPALHRTCAGCSRSCVRHSMVPRSSGGTGWLGSTASGFGARGIGSGSPAPRPASGAWCPPCSSICAPSTAV